jgi:hypothetical protein
MTWALFNYLANTFLTLSYYVQYYRYALIKNFINLIDLFMLMTISDIMDHYGK